MHKFTGTHTACTPLLSPLQAARPVKRLPRLQKREDGGALPLKVTAAAAPAAAHPTRLTLRAPALAPLPVELRWVKAQHACRGVDAEGGGEGFLVLDGVDEAAAVGVVMGEGGEQ